MGHSWKIDWNIKNRPIIVCRSSNVNGRSYVTRTAPRDLAPRDWYIIINILGFKRFALKSVAEP